MSVLNITQLNVSQTSAPTPSNLQQKGPMISQGATTLSQGESALITGAAGIQSILAAPLSLTSLTWSGGTVTATTAAAIPGLTNGDTFITAIASATPSGYNNSYFATVTGTNTFTFALASNPGAETAPGTYTPPSQQALIAMVDEFYAQGQSQAVYVLELGAGDGASGPTALSAWINDNPGVFYAYLVPRSWDGEENFIALAKAYATPSSSTYFFTTTTTETYTQYIGIKSVWWFVEAPDANATLDTFDCASLFQMWLSNAPTAAAPMLPMAYRFSYGTTAWQDAGNASTLTTLATAGVNFIYPAAQGGLSENMLWNGKTADGKPGQYWYAVDYAIINLQLNQNNSIISAANNGVPIDYDQDGIDVEQDVALNTFATMAAANLLNGTISGTDLTGTQFQQNFNDGDYSGQNVVNAIPYTTYVAQNPSAYAEQEYGGFSAVMTPMVGFASIIFNLNVVDFA